MPRVTVEHEQEVRGRIVEAALRVFGDRGFHRATMQDIVRESGLSIGAIYTYFKSKDELFLASCDISSGDVAGELAVRLTHGSTTAARLAIGVGFFLDALDVFGANLGSAAVLVHAWAEAEQEPPVREVLVRRREQAVTIGRLLIQEGIASGELPSWVDPQDLATAYSALLDGLTLLRIERGPRYARDEALRHAMTVLELLLAATGSPRPEVPSVAPGPYAPPLRLGGHD